MLNPTTMEALELFRGDSIIVRFVDKSLAVRVESYTPPQWKEAEGHCPHLSELA